MIKEIYVATIDGEPEYSADTKEKVIDYVIKDMKIKEFPKKKIKLAKRDLALGMENILSLRNYYVSYRVDKIIYSEGE